MYRVFLADHDLPVTGSIGAGLAELGYAVEAVHDRALAVAVARSAGGNVALLQCGRPIVRGGDVARQLEDGLHRLPVLLITDAHAATRAPAGAETGADLRGTGSDTMPFALAQIAERLRLQLDNVLGTSSGGAPQQPAPSRPSTLRVADLEIERGARRVFRAGVRIDVTRREYLLLEYFALHPGEPVTREAIAREVWQVENRATPLDNVIDVHIGHLRRKLTVAGRAALIHTIRGVGYRLSATPDEPALRD